jgi:hypothetical protein
MSVPVHTAIIYSFIAFSIVFIVLSGLTVMIFAMRLLTGGKEPPKTPSSSSLPPSTPRATPAAKAAETRTFATAADVKTRHVAAITSAIWAITQGAGRIVRIIPSGRIPSGRSQSRSLGMSPTWRAAAVVESVNRGIEPAWKH